MSKYAQFWRGGKKHLFLSSYRDWPGLLDLLALVLLLVRALLDELLASAVAVGHPLLHADGDAGKK